MTTTKDAIIEILVPVVEKLDEAEIKFVLIGGITVPFYFTDPELVNFRPTKDVDLIVAAVKFSLFERVEARLRKVGFQNHPEVIHRWTLGKTLIDIMPAESDFMQTINRWYPSTFKTAGNIELVKGCFASIASPACFLATKLEAFINRGGGDFLGSHDLEDIISVVDGRESLVKDIERNCPMEVREFLRITVKSLLVNQGFIESLEGHLPPEKRTPERMESLLRRLKEIASTPV